MLPSKLRDQLGSEVVLAKSVDPCITLYRAEGWKAYCDKLDALPNTETRFVKRFLYSSAFETGVDGQGRVLLPSDLCEYAGLTKDVIVVGLGDHLELWAPERWQAENSKESGMDIAGTLIKLGF